MTSNGEKLVCDVGESSKKEMKGSEATITDWRKLFSAGEDQALQYYPPPKKSNGEMIVSPLLDVFEEGEQKWKNAVVVQFVRRIPNFSLFRRMVKILWGKDGDIEIKPAGYNLFII